MSVKAQAQVEITSVKDIKDAADAAQGEIDNQQEYFWHDALGAHVLSDTDEVTGNRYRTDLKGAGQEIFELDGQNETSVASFGANGARLGQTGGAHSIIDADGQRFYASDGTTQLANIGYGEGAAQSGTDTAPYYSFGVRIPNSSVGNFSVAEGYNTTASGYTSHAEGQNTKASAYCAHAEGGGTTASGESAHAEGSGTTASGIRAHAEGDNAVASGYGAHAEGGSTTASGFCAHAEGNGTVANGYFSHAQNQKTIAAKTYQTAIGRYNIEDTETIASKQKAFIIGNGTSSAYSNAFTVDWEGNTEAAGEITDGNGNVLSDKADSSSLARVATSGSYNDLANKPSLAAVATSGSYNDLTNKPSLPEIAKAGAVTITPNKNINIFSSTWYSGVATVAFDEPFDALPALNVTSQGGINIVYVSDVSTTKFNITVCRPTTSAVNVHWMAMKRTQ